MVQIVTWNALCLFLFLCIYFQSQETLAAASFCRYKLTGNSGTFTSPNYHAERPSVKSRPKTLCCQWEIEVARGKGIQLKFGDFDMNAPLDECPKGEVEIYSGTGKKKQSIDKYCPGNKADTVTLLNNTATVVFRRPSDFSGTGFLISYIATTPGETISDFVTCSDTGSKHVNVASFWITCPSGCGAITQHTVKGSLPYREDSHLCRAAVHAGVISDQFGGRVAMRKEPGKPLYYGSAANNVTSKTGPMADYQINFPGVNHCHDVITIGPRQVSASSFLNETGLYESGGVWYPRNVLFSSLGAWSPGDVTKPQWLQVDLKKVMNITGIITRGSQKPYTYTKNYIIKYSNNNITWKPYVEDNHFKTKIFAGNTNSFSDVRNNFVRSTILARYIRVYPTILVDQDLAQQGLKLKLTGCDVIDPSLLEEPTLLLPRTTTEKTTTTSKTTPTISNSFEKKDNSSLSKIGDHDQKPTPPTKTPNLTYPLSEKKNINEKIPGNENPAASERSILIIAIVAALAVTSILLAALVLFLVRKRRKEPKHDTAIPKPTAQNNIIYHTPIGMPYAPSNNHKNKKGSQKNSNKNGASANGVSIVNSFAQGGVTLQYDQEQPLINGHSNGQHMVSASYSKNPNQSTFLARAHSHRDEAECDFTSDDGEHEYQVIDGPVTECDPRLQTNSSKSSSNGSSMGNKSVGSAQWQHGFVWGNAGDVWSREQTLEKRPMTSFMPQNGAQRSPSSRSGSFSQQTHYSVKEESNPFLSGVQSSGGKFNPPKFFIASRGRSQSPQGSASSGLGASYKRFSSSSTGSSSHAAVDPSHRRNPSVPYYSSVPKTQSFSNREMEFVFPSQQPHSGKSQPPSIEISDNGDVFSSAFPPSSNGNAKTQPKSSLSNGKNDPRFDSNSNTLNQPNLRCDYDQLYRKKTLSDGNRSVVAMTKNNYDQLNLNTPV